MVKENSFTTVEIMLWKDIYDKYTLYFSNINISISEQQAIDISEKFNLEINILPF